MLHHTQTPDIITMACFLGVFQTANCIDKGLFSPWLHPLVRSFASITLHGACQRCRSKQLIRATKRPILQLSQTEAYLHSCHASYGRNFEYAQQHFATTPQSLLRLLSPLSNGGGIIMNLVDTAIRRIPADDDIMLLAKLYLTDHRSLLSQLFTDRSPLHQNHGHILHAPHKMPSKPICVSFAPIMSP